MPPHFMLKALGNKFPWGPKKVLDIHNMLWYITSGVWSHTVWTRSMTSIPKRSPHRSPGPKRGLHMSGLRPEPQPYGFSNKELKP
jgi:hypothetical protein